MGLFGKKKDPKKVIAESLTTVRKQKRQIERQIQTLQREEEKAIQVIRQAARNGQTQGCRNIAVTIANSRKVSRRQQTVKFRLDSVEINLQQQRSMLRQSGEVEASTEVMADMNELVKAPELTKAVKKMTKQLQKIGLMDEEIHFAVETTTAADDDDVDDDEEVEKVLQTATTTGGTRSARDQLMNSRAISHEPSAGATRDRQRATPATTERRSVSVVERTSRTQAHPLLA